MQAVLLWPNVLVPDADAIAGYVHSFGTFACDCNSIKKKKHFMLYNLDVLHVKPMTKLNMG